MSDVTSRFIELLELLKSNGVVASNKEFASAIGVSTSLLTELKKGRSKVGVEAIQNTVRQYKVDSNWFFTGEPDGYLLGYFKGYPNPKVHSKVTIKGNVGAQNNIGDNANMTNYFGNEPKMPQLQESEVKYKTQIDLLNEELRAKELEIAKLQGQVELLKTMLNK